MRTVTANSSNSQSHRDSLLIAQFTPQNFTDWRFWQLGTELNHFGLLVTSQMGFAIRAHIFFGERWYGFDDAMYTAGRLLEILSREADPSAVLNALPTSFNLPPEAIDRLREIGARLLRTSPDFQRLLRELPTLK